ncbi:MAG: deoxyribose-phosphate aldolase [Spirochaetes bacterium]|nr:deoxyribose-phosphate aldolase [Spirochaetota bacterium]
MNCGNWQCIIQNRSAVDNVINAGADRISTNPGISSDAQKLASMIDHTLLKPEATINQIKTLCTEARRYKFASVCINPAFVSICRDELTGSDVKVCTVIGFPLGSVTTLAKAFETRDAIANGAGEIDMVINIGLLKSKHDKNVEDDIRAVVEAAMGSTVKVILETALLTDDEIIRACKLSKQAGAHFVKTSTGFAKSGASVHAVELMRQTVGPHMGVKASGGIRNFNDADKMIKAGASRIGASASVAIIKKEGSTSDY